MLRPVLFLFALSCGYASMSSAHAAEGCVINGSPLNIFLPVPKMAIPADTPDGTVLYTSPKQSINLNCSSTGRGKYVSVVTTDDFNKYLSQKNGIKTTVYIDGIPFDRQKDYLLGFTDASSSFKKTLSVWVEFRTDYSRGKLPVQGSLFHGSFQSIFFIEDYNYLVPRGVLALTPPDITFIPCSMEVSVSPDTIDFGMVKISDLDNGKKLQRRFSTLIKKSRYCTAVAGAPFGINVFFEPTSSGLNADGSLNLNNGLGLSISDSSGKYIPYNTAWKIDDVLMESVLRNTFTAKLQKISGHDIKTGPFSADVVVRLSYY
ncbi:fimbrial protein [Salmonella enterica]